VPCLLPAATDAKALSILGMRCFGFAPLRLPEWSGLGKFAARSASRGQPGSSPRSNVRDHNVMETGTTLDWPLTLRFGIE